MNREPGMDTCTLLVLCIRQTADKDTLQSTGTSTRCSVAWALGNKSKKKRGDACVPIADPLCCVANLTQPCQTNMPQLKKKLNTKNSHWYKYNYEDIHVRRGSQIMILHVGFRGAVLGRQCSRQAGRLVSLVVILASGHEDEVNWEHISWCQVPASFISQGDGREWQDENLRARNVLLSLWFCPSAFYARNSVTTCIFRIIMIYR